MKKSTLVEAVDALKAGAVVAYPTESCFGLGCDPTKDSAIQRVLSFKDRPWQKGLLIIAASVEQLYPYIDIEDVNFDKALDGWPGPTTWVVPASSTVNPLLRGEHNGIAVRVTDHPVARSLCETFGGAIVSTSANTAGLAPALSAKQVRDYFLDEVFVLDGDIGSLEKPTPIYDLLSERIIRS